MSSLNLAKLATHESAGGLDDGGPVKRGLDQARVLLVDDSRLIRMGLRRSLEGIGLKDITEAGHGREAIELLARDRFDLSLRGM